MEEKLNIEENKNTDTDLSVGVQQRVSRPLEYNKIYWGDSFELCKRVPAKTVDVILEDMPYNTTACEWDVKIDLQLYWETRLRILKPTGVVILTASQPFTSELVMSNYKMFKYEWIWRKNAGSNFAITKYQPMKEHENIVVFSAGVTVYNPIKERRAPSGYASQKSPLKFNRSGEGVYGDGMDELIKKRIDEMRVPSSVQDFDRERGEHPTQKPVGLFEYLIRTYSNEGDLVFDGFGGSGTTAIAAHKCKRNFIVIEKEKKYFDLAVRRLDVERAQLTIF